MAAPAAERRRRSSWARRIFLRAVLPRRRRFRRGSSLRSGFRHRLTPARVSTPAGPSAVFAGRSSARDVSITAFSFHASSRLFWILRVSGLLRRRLLLDGGLLFRRTTITAPRTPLLRSQNDSSAAATGHRSPGRRSCAFAGAAGVRPTGTRHSAAPQPKSRSEPSTPTLLVFRDKHTQEVQNYAIVGGTLWIFSEERATKLPLSWLDIEATTKANEDRGVDFQLPK